MPEIKFSATESRYVACPHPVPASKIVPEWYKKLPRGRDGVKDISNTWFIDPDQGLVPAHTIKECIPVRDYITSGYVIPLWADVVIKQDENRDYLYWLDKNTMKIDSHPYSQVSGCPVTSEVKKDSAILKFISPWQVETPPGYSCMFYTPRYNSSPVEILPAIVDTDKCHTVNFPFIVKNIPNGNELRLNRGEPVVQVLPFKRETWTSEVKYITDDRWIGRVWRNISVLGDGYRKLMHSKKFYS